MFDSRGMDKLIEQRIADSFGKQTLMQTLGARIVHVSEGCVEIGADLAAHVLQQHGYGHAGLTFAIGDSAAGYAALTLFPNDTEVLTAEMKINLLSPASGERLLARGRVIKPGKRLCIVGADVYAQLGDQQIHVAILQGTMVPVDRRG